MTETLALRPRDAAKALGISRAQLYVLISEGRIKTVRLSPRIQVITMDEIRALLAA